MYVSKWINFNQYKHQGIPTHDKEGQEITKSKRKKLVKDFEAQDKLNKEYMAFIANGGLDQ